MSAGAVRAATQAPEPLPLHGQVALPVVRAALAEHYGLDAVRLLPLGGEVDQNLAVDVTDGRRIVAKIAPPGTDPAHLRWQHRLLARLGTADVPDVPHPVAALNGDALVRVDVGDGPRFLRVQTWLPGRTMAELDRHAPRLLRDWGSTAARLVEALAGEPDAPARPPSHHWDALRADEAVASQLGAVRDPRRRALVQTIMATFERWVVPVRAELPRQVLHQDLNDFNVLTRPGDDGGHRVAGVLDFTDALHTARVNELAIAMAYAMLREPDPLLAATEVVRGYLDRSELTDVELATAFPIAAARLCVNATTWTAREAANGAYARARMQHTWPALARLVDVAPALAEAQWRSLAGRRPEVFAPRAVDTTVRVLGEHLAPLPGTPPRRRAGAAQPATLRLGVDVDGPVALPVEGVVESSPAGTVLVRHDGEHRPYWTRWTPVADAFPAGSALPAGTVIAAGEPQRELRVAAFTDGQLARSAPPAVPPSTAGAWLQVAPDPGVLFGRPSNVPTPPPPREAHVARSQRAYYDQPPHLVASSDVWVYDDHGLAYLDVMNNVAHVGHANPAVLTALARQASLLNINSRLTYDGFARYASRLAALLPDPLEVVFLVCTGSEANDLALRIARQVTARRDVMVIDGAYHGNTTAVTDVSPDRYKGPGGSGAPPTTHEVPRPDRYRGRYRDDDPTAGRRYAQDACAVVDRLVADGRPPAAFLAESLMGTAGVVVHPPGYLAAVFERVRRAGGLCISDEVQVGFGRLGPQFWGFAGQGVVPDIVTMGKPIGNGHPMAAVVTTRAVADAFDTGMKYFNTFGGNPVSCAVGEAVLDELQSRALPEHAVEVGGYLRRRLDELAARHELVGDVRGAGLYLGVELVRDRATREPAAAEARYLCELLKDDGVLTYPTGVCGNVLKVKPPLTFTESHADLLVDALDAALTGER